MPKSRIRKKADYTPPPSKQTTAIKLNSRAWVAPVMLAMFLIGLAWIVVFYLSQGAYPIPGGFGAKNLFVGFGIVLVGFAMTTRWR